MKKYLVIADTYQYGYGCEYTLFGVFDTREDAVRWIIDHPIVILREADDVNDEEKFSFFEDFEDGFGQYYIGPNGNKVRFAGPETKEEYALRYVNEFNGNPMYIGGYQE